jgi:hypothetical protein
MAAAPAGVVSRPVDFCYRIDDLATAGPVSSDVGLANCKPVYKPFTLPWSPNRDCAIDRTSESLYTRSESLCSKA